MYNLRRMPLAWQVIHALDDRRVLATSPAELRALARTVLDAGGDALLCFRAADNHLHSVLLADRATVGVFGRLVANTLHHRLRLPVPFEPTRFRPVHDQGHLRSVFGYVLGNAEHHGAGHDPFFEASNLPDLLGLREVGAATRTRVRAALPRVDRAALLTLLGVDALAPRFAAEHLLASACAVAGLPSLEQRTSEALAARIAAAHLAARHVSAHDLEAILHVSARTGARLRAAAANPALVTGIALQMDLRARKNIAALTAPYGSAGLAS
ncbi:MAG: hypothetical protein Q8P18_02755 [Pseudomonadota bacterium]|nr:hypothetical protein [Pseudomonadota bacterium]